MKAFIVKGSIKGARKPRPFTKEFAAESEDAVRELILSSFGSLYRVKRPGIKIIEVTEITDFDTLEDQAEVPMHLVQIRY